MEEARCLFPEPIITLKFAKDNGRITVILIFIVGQIKRNRSNTSGAGYTACVAFFVILYNGKIVQWRRVHGCPGLCRLTMAATQLLL